MTEKRFTYWEEDIGQMLIPQCRDNGKTVARSVYECVDLLNEQHEENMMLRSKHTRLIILLKDIIDDLKRMDTRGYAEHIEKSENINFLGMEDYE